jgi:ABC-type lipoprotein release transport system permease subunit
MIIIKIMLLFCVLAIIITSLSLFGLVLTETVKAAFFVALPASYFIGKNWDESFAHQTTLHLWIFAFACFLTSWRAATKNPFEALRYE